MKFKHISLSIYFRCERLKFVPIETDHAVEDFLLTVPQNSFIIIRLLYISKLEAQHVNEERYYLTQKISISLFTLMPKAIRSVSEVSIGFKFYACALYVTTIRLIRI